MTSEDRDVFANGFALVVCAQFWRERDGLDHPQAGFRLRKDESQLSRWWHASVLESHHLLSGLLAQTGALPLRFSTMGLIKRK